MTPGYIDFISGYFNLKNGGYANFTDSKYRVLYKFTLEIVSK